MENWREQLKYNPIPTLLASENEAIRYFVRRDLLGEEAGPIAQLWQLPKAQRVFKKQLSDGSWEFPGKQDNPVQNYRLVETWKQFRLLVEVYGFNREHTSTARAAEFIFTCQTEAGDFRGFIGDQYATYYTGALMSLLIRAGYEHDPRIEKGFQWLLAMRQDDLGWSIPVITHDFDWKTVCQLTSQDVEPVEANRSKPFSHNATGMILRAFAAHPVHRHTEAARIAANLLKSRFFQPDRYTSYRAASYWVRFQYPFWWNNLVAALDSISLIDPTRDEPMGKAISWLIDHQEAAGLWKTTYVTGKEVNNTRSREEQEWVSLAICSVLKRVQ